MEITNNYASVNFKILTPTDLKTKLNGAWRGASYDVNDSKDMNDI